MATTLHKYTGSVQSYHPDGSRGCSMGLGADTPEHLIAQLVPSALHYLSLGYRVQLERLAELCPRCNGSGYTGAKIRRTCVKCTGRGTINEREPIEFKAPGSVAVSDAGESPRQTRTRRLRYWHDRCCDWAKFYRFAPGGHRDRHFKLGFLHAKREFRAWQSLTV